MWHAKTETTSLGHGWKPAGVRLLAFDDYFPRLLDFALAANWGKRPLPHPRSAAHARSDQHPAPSPPPESQP